MKIQTTETLTFYLTIFDNFIDQVYMCGAALHSSKFLKWKLYGQTWNFSFQRSYFADFPFIWFNGSRHHICFIKHQSYLSWDKVFSVCFYFTSAFFRDKHSMNKAFLPFHVYCLIWVIKITIFPMISVQRGKCLSQEKLFKENSETSFFCPNKRKWLSLRLVHG